MQNERRDHFYNFSHITGGLMLIFTDWYFNELHKVSPLMFMTCVCYRKLCFQEFKRLNAPNMLEAMWVKTAQEFKQVGSCGTKTKACPCAALKK